MKHQSYFSPRTLDDAVRIFSEHERPVVPVAGATDLMVKARTRDWYENCDLMALDGIKELSEVTEKDGFAEIGSMVTAAQILKSPLLLRDAKILCQSCEKLGSPQIRNMATIGGNLANSCLAADMVPALCVLDAVIDTVGPDGQREIQASGFMKDCVACLNDEEATLAKCFFGIPQGKKNVLKTNEIITKIRIPVMGPEYQVRFQKIMRRQTGCMSKFTFACAMKKEGGKITDIRISIGSAFSSVRRHPDAESLLLGSSGEIELLQKAARLLGDQIEAQQKNPNEPQRYKAEVCRRLLPRTLEEMVRE